MANNENFMNNPICLFDSGIGGLTVLKKLIAAFPHEIYIYLADLKNVPFGDKSKDEIKHITRNIIDWLLRFNPKIIIMACNTSSTILDQTLLNQYLQSSSQNSRPQIFGMINSCTKEVSRSGIKKISVFATKLTVEYNGYKNAIQSLNQNLIVEEIACPKLVPMVESLNTNKEERKRIISEYTNIISKDSDGLILGSTHYPLIENDIKELININLINPADALISELNEMNIELKLEKISVSNSSNIKGEVTIYSTVGKDKLEKFSRLYLQNVYPVKEVTISKETVMKT